MSRDTQKSKVYKWERSFFGEDHDRSVWTEDQCVKYINEAYKWWTSNKNAKTVKVKFENSFNSNRSSHFKLSTNTIKIQRKWATNPFVCSHELAHYIHYNDVCRGEVSHGPVFMRVMLTLIDKFTEHSLGDMIKSARAAKVKVAGLRVPKTNKYYPNQLIRRPASNTFYIPKLTEKDLKFNSSEVYTREWYESTTKITAAKPKKFPKPSIFFDPILVGGKTIEEFAAEMDNPSGRLKVGEWAIGENMVLLTNKGSNDYEVEPLKGFNVESLHFIEHYDLATAKYDAHGNVFRCDEDCDCGEVLSDKEIYEQLSEWISDGGISPKSGYNPFFKIENDRLIKEYKGKNPTLDFFQEFGLGIESRTQAA